MEEEKESQEELLEELKVLRSRVAELEDKKAQLRNMKEFLSSGAEAFAVLLECSPELSTVVDADARIMSAAPSVEKALGYKPEELAGRSIFDFVFPDEVPALQEFFTICMGTPRHSLSMEFRFRHADGSWHTLDATCINLIHNTAVRGIVLTARDITERKQAEETVAARERYYRSLIRNAADMVSVLDENLAFKWGSPSASRITGYGPEDVYGRTILDFLHPEDVETAKKDYEFILANPDQILTGVRRFRHKDGTYHWHEAILNNLLGDPSVRGIIVNSRDITERKLMEEELLASNRELDSFATTVSHDLRTPLSLIEGYAQLLRAQSNTEEEKEAYLKSIIAAAKRMDELTESLLGYAQAGKSEGTISSVEPLDVVSDALFEHSVEIERGDIDIAVGEEFPALKVDQYKLRQVFSNLINNAVKYLADTPRPCIEIGSRAGQDQVTFYIRDNGPGLDPEVEEEIFQPFKRFGTARSPGLGIGLSTVKRAVEGWGGRVWVESEPGQGATFFFTAPLG